VKDISKAGRFSGAGGVLRAYRHTCVCNQKIKRAYLG